MAEQKPKLNKDGLEPGKPVTYDQIRSAQAKRKVSK